MSENLWAVIHIPNDSKGPALICTGEALRLWEQGPLIIERLTNSSVAQPMVIPWQHIKSLHLDKTDADREVELLRLELTQIAELQQQIDNEEAEEAFERLKKIRIQKFETDFG